ncbi:alpha/beta hydrolase family protein [Streptosporangium carneum]|uniref:alpha/beta hydrolase family protein n=1 Tax=Streptosporangium carneum TaxID=47481 RepID=UPI0022F2DBE6|nr:alpha/beta hydrolase [Streptosporangium carneum]
MSRPKRSRGLRRLLTALSALLLAAVAATGAVVWQHTYDLREERVTIPNGRQRLDGVLALPTSGRGPYGLVVFVHGDKPIDATHDGFYRPMWEAFARSGYASLSWNKPGVAGSGGDWLAQSMEDRADEVTAALAWARTRADIDPRRMGLWGGSQAGWVMPKVAARTPDLRFVIAVSPAINWLRQGRYNLLAELRAEGAPPAAVKAALERRETTLRLLRAGATFEEYHKTVADTGDMTAARWGFIARNHRADATEDLSRARVPTLLILAGHDLNVDVAETEAVYRASPAPLKVVRYPGAVHSMLRREVAESEVMTTLTGLFAPRALFPDGFLAGQAAFLRERTG